jgi:hypothetical protein
MNFVYLIPFSYFYFTRLRHASLAFHLVFEWLAALFLVSFFGDHGWLAAISASLLSYFAFVSIYEIGYLANDLFSAKRETDGRARGPQGADWRWIACWIAVRVIAFVTIAAALDRLFSGQWWSFFTALGLVLVSHNALVDRELKAISFIWLSWFRFMAPVIFVVDASQVPGIGLCAAMSYCCFRLLGYLDSKGLLKMPGRQRSRFRLSFFSAPLCGALALWKYQGTDGFVALSGYYFLAAIIGVFSRNLQGRF